MNRFIQYSLTIAAAGVFYMCGDDVDKKNGDSTASSGEEKVNLPGDNFDLYAALDAFKSSKNLEAFEKKLNDKSGKINNLDLNGDGKVDYVRVVDHKKDNAHTIVLRVPVSKKESQDVAVIEIDKKDDKTAYLQIIGDEELYGKDYIVEPKPKEKAAGFVVATAVGVNVWYWPCVTYIYSPDYVVVYESPYYYDYYPAWWEPYPVVAYEVYYPVVYPYHEYYYHPDGYRFVEVHEHYTYRERYESPYVHEHRHELVAPGGAREPNGNAYGPNNRRSNDGRAIPVPGNGNHDNGRNARGGQQQAIPTPGGNRHPQQGNNTRSGNHGKAIPAPGGNQRTMPQQHSNQRTQQQAPQQSAPIPHPQNNQRVTPGGHQGMPPQQQRMPAPQQPQPRAIPTPGGNAPHGGDHIPQAPVPHPGGVNPNGGSGGGGMHRPR